MDRKEVAKKIREAIFNRIEEDRAIHASSIEQEVEKVLGAMSIGTRYRRHIRGAQHHSRELPNSPALYQAMLAQVEIITHPEAADK